MNSALRSERQTLDRDIRDLNLEPVSFLVAVEQGWPLEQIDDIELQYRCFLQVIRDYPEQLIVPTREIDIYWHAHVLTLELYLDQCQKLFGRPLLHFPFSGRLGAADAATQTQRSRNSRPLIAELVNRVRSAHILKGDI